MGHPFFSYIYGMECLEKIVGLSRKDCECFTDDRPADWNESLSGLYLDELSGLTQKNIDTSKDCGEGSIWDIMEKALENGERTFRTDLLSGVNKKWKDILPTFEGQIGKKDFNGLAPQTTPLHGVRIESNCIKGSCMVLTGIDTFFDTTIAVLPIRIYRSDCEDPIHEFNVETTAMKRKVNKLDTPIELPLYIEGLEDFNYSIVYDLPAGVEPCNTKLACTCNKNKKRPWALWVNAEGIKGQLYTDIATLDDEPGTAFTYGLNLTSKIYCKKATIICNEGHVWDFTNDDIALQIAHAIQEISGVNLINEILTRPDSSYFALNEEQLMGLGAQYALSYQDRIDYLSLNIKPTNNDCFICNDQMRAVGVKA